MTKPYIKLKKEVHEALESNKYVFCCGMQGEGKTYTGILEGVNNYKNTVFISDAHKLNNEINMNFLDDHSLILNNVPHIVNLFGADFDKIPPKIQKIHGYPACLCNYNRDPDYYLKKLKYLPKDWCYYPDELTQEKINSSNLNYTKLIEENKKGHCPYVDVCAHKKMIYSAIESLQYSDNINVIWLMVKAYLDTNMLDAFLKVDMPVGIIDENILGLCYEQVTLNAKGIRDFNDLADSISKKNHSLREIYVALRDIFRLIDNFITYNKDIKIEIKAKKITDKVEEFLQSFKLEDIKKWDEKFKATSLKHLGIVKKTYNIMSIIIKMLEKNKEDLNEFEKNLTTDPDNPVISLFISKVKKIRETVHKFHKLIFTDALLPTVISEITELLQIEDDYKILHDKTRKAKWKEVKVFRLNNEEYGGYPKNTLLNIFHDDVSKSFFKLIELSENIIQFEAERDRNIGLIGSMKIFQHNRFGTTIQKELSPIIERYDMDVKYQHYGAVPGENTYDDVNWEIMFGGYNSPHRDRKIISNIVGINMDKLEYLHGPGTIVQFAHRGRPLQRPNKVSAYFLTNEIKGCFEQEENLKSMPTILHRDLIKLIHDNAGITTNEIIEKMNKPKSSMLKVLDYLVQEDLIKNRTYPSGRGRPSLIWYVL